MGTMILLDLMGAVALLLWGLHMVRTGINGPHRNYMYQPTLDLTAGACAPSASPPVHSRVPRPGLSPSRTMCSGRSPLSF
jgi:hypothetical protein